MVLLHQSPVSSAEYEHMIRTWGDGLTLIAPDTPSFGLSDSLFGEEPLIEPYAQGLAEFLTAIGVERCGIYGTHTGAMIAAEFARAYPDRCDVCVLNGYVVATDAEKTDVLANYFIPLTPVADGSHMVWAWVRMRDQMIFYPWYRKTAATRMTFDVPSADFLQPFMMDFFRSANAGLRAYKAAFTYDAIDGLKGMTAPCYVMAFKQDVLHEHLGRIPKDIPACVTLEGHPLPTDVEARAQDLFKLHCKGATPPHTATATIPNRLWQSYATLTDGQIYVRRSHMGSGRPVVLLHDAGQSSRQWYSVMQMLHGKRPVLAFDLPGHGETGTAAGANYNVDAITSVIHQALNDVGCTEVDLLAAGAGCAVAAQLKQRISEHIKNIVLVDPWAFTGTTASNLKAHLAPKLSPTWYGGHLVEAWAVARDSELYWPWFEPLQANSIQSQPDLDPQSVHAKAVELLKAQAGHSAFVASAVDFDVKASLQKSKAGVTIAAVTNGPHATRAETLAEQAGAAFISLSDNPDRKAAALAALFMK